MRKLYKREGINKVVLVSGDGDYFKMVDFLIKENKLEKILFPARKKASSLYRGLAPKYFDSIDNPDIKRKIIYIKNKK
ncbi:hypothetical protein FWF74_01485 [Candidatus Saccharibacteria bacterium]|nr:hypothetical protein [Candidatus Saccharibacteria bacterium]MCL1963120.1 hypothetical protein [Candidatus Saccharibacteria bacterium]